MVKQAEGSHLGIAQGAPRVNEFDPTSLGESLNAALRYVAIWQGRRVVIKFGGSSMAAGDIGTLIEDIVALHRASVQPIVVHGGGPEISKRLTEQGIEARFVDGLRVTDEATISVVEDVLAGSANRRLVEMIEAHGVDAQGMSGHEGAILVSPHPNRELGYVGVVETIDTAPIEAALAAGRIPVIAPLGRGPDGRTYNVNADTAAAAIAGALGAAKFLLLTDVNGVYRPLQQVSGDGSSEVAEKLVLISELTSRGARRLIEEGVIAKGMIPKVEACLAAIAAEVPRAHVLNAGTPHGLLVELFTEAGIGTMITDRTTVKGKTTVSGGRQVERDASFRKAANGGNA